MNLQLEGSCCICGNNKVGFFDSFKSCGNGTHKIHKNCLKSVIKDFSLLSFIENCEQCINEFIKEYKSNKQCLKCRKVIVKRVDKSDCKWKLSFCDRCLWKPYAINHRNSCLDCSRISCTDCKESVNVRFCSSGIRCLDHSFCIVCIKNVDYENCETCYLYISKAVYECLLCGDPLSLSDVCCKSGHFFCKFCLQHFIWTPNDCVSCKNLFEVKNKSIISVKYYKSPYQSFRTDLKRSLPTNTCYICNTKGKYPISQSIKCSNCYYCLECLNGRTLPYGNCENCSDIFKKNSKIIPKNAIICCLCWNVPDGTSKFCENFHYFCIKCRDYLIQVDKIMLFKVLSCKKCVKEIRALRQYAELYLSPSETVLIVIPKFKFICGHEIRHDSLSKILISAIVHFLDQLKNLNIEELNKGFITTCEFCDQRIFVPFQKFARSLQPTFDPDEWCLVQHFSSIFDGLPYTFSKSDNEIACFIGDINIFTQDLN